jgi:hypothetical protein
MPQDEVSRNAEMGLIRQRLLEAYPHANPFTEPLREKLAHCLHKKERCEALLDRATQALKSDGWTLASAAQKQEFLLNMRQTKTRVQELNRLIRRYASALNANERCLGMELQEL